MSLHMKIGVVGILLLGGLVMFGCASGDDTTEFPTGRFINEDNDKYIFEFNEDGTWRHFQDNLEVPAVFGRYSISGNYYTEMTHEPPGDKKIPVTYTWTYDGQKLTFHLWGEDVMSNRQGYYDDQTYIKVDITEFPTGRFINEDNDRYIFEFDEDGTWRHFQGNLEKPAVSGRYGISGNYYSEMTFEYPGGTKIPVTYTWTYDGQKLMFHLWGEDVMSHRQGCYDNQTYIKVE